MITMLDPQTQALYARTAEIIKAIAHPHRVAVIDFLRDGEKCVQEIADHLGAERSNVSRHLAVMLKAGALRSRKDGLMVFYALRTPCVANFLNCAMQTLKHNVDEESQVLSQVY